MTVAKLLSMEEAEQIAAAICKERGLPEPDLTETEYHTRCNYSIQVYLPRESFWPWNRRAKEFEISGGNLEEVLTKLEIELTNRFNARAEAAEQFRSRYAMKEADRLLDNTLRNQDA